MPLLDLHLRIENFSHIKIFKIAVIILEFERLIYYQRKWSSLFWVCTVFRLYVPILKVLWPCTSLLPTHEGLMEIKYIVVSQTLSSCSTIVNNFNIYVVAKI